MADDDKSGLPILPFETAEAFEAWLAEHHAAAPGVWLKLGKKGGPASITYAQALDCALTYGWIDSHKAGFDDLWFLQRFTPRKPRGRWSQINRDKIEALIAQGRMKPPGMAEVDAAKADGRWDAAYAGQATMAVPDDLAAALMASPKARQFFESIDRANRYAVLYRIHDARTSKTRAERITKFVAMLERGETIH